MFKAVSVIHRSIMYFFVCDSFRVYFDVTLIKNSILLTIFM